MDALIWIGALVSLIGLGGILYCIYLVRRAKKTAGDDDGILRAALQKVLPMNLGALFLSVIGLMMVVVGVLLG
ncbi:MAG: hypothetical protein P8M63_05320 [Paracoccaceae bacterium]|jgi:hypothetical protein|nr:hypothetical protein [Paracoccaceae bacterium]